MGAARPEDLGQERGPGPDGPLCLGVCIPKCRVGFQMWGAWARAETLSNAFRGRTVTMAHAFTFYLVELDV